MNERYKTYQKGFSFCRLGHALRVGWGYLGVQNYIPSGGLPVMLSPPNHWTKFNQIWCVSYSHAWGLQQQEKFWPRPLRPLGGVKRSNITKSISKIFIPNFVPQGWDFGALGVPKWSKKVKHGHVVYQIDGDDEKNRMQA